MSLQCLLPDSCAELSFLARPWADLAWLSDSAQLLFAASEPRERRLGASFLQQALFAPEHKPGTAAANASSAPIWVPALRQASQAAEIQGRGRVSGGQFLESSGITGDARQVFLGELKAHNMAVSSSRSLRRMQVLIVCEEENKEMFNIDEMCNIAGYARFPLWWELMHITFCRIPMLLYFLLMLAIILSVMLLWVFSGVSLVTVLASTGCVLVVSVLVVLAIRKARAATAHSKQRRRKELLAEKELIQKFSEACWEANQQLEHEARVALLHVGWTEEDLDELTYRTLKCQSQEAGVSVAYLLSDPFLNLARVRSKETNPSFYTLKDVFFFGDDPIGKNIPCPRDGRLGCALVDTLPRHHRQQCTHYLSWTWNLWCILLGC